MYHCESTLALVDCEQEVDGYSSGYESQTSDSESTGICSGKVQPTKQSREPVKIQERMSYRNTKTLTEHLRTISSIPELCDVTFKVGADRVPVYGVKAILGTRSKPLYNLILKKQKEMENSKDAKKRKGTRSLDKIVIAVKKYEVEDFQKIIQFIHSGSVDINSSCVAGLLCGSTQFGLDDLESACWDFVNHSIKSGSISNVVSSAKNYCHYKAGQRLLETVFSHTPTAVDL